MTNAPKRLRAALSQLEGSKITDRKAGLAALQEFFKSNLDARSLKYLDDLWSQIFDAVKDAFLKEKVSATKPPKGHSGPASLALGRMESLAKLIHTIVNKYAYHVPRKVVIDLMEWARRNMALQNEVLDDICLPLLRAIDDLLCSRLHVEYMGDDTWVKLVTTCFNLLLKDKFNSKLSDNLDEGSEDSYEHTDDSDSSLMEIDQVAPSQKRRHEQRVNHGDTRGGMSKKTPPTNVQVAAMSLLRRLLTSPLAPLLSQGDPSRPSAILDRMARIIDSDNGFSNNMHYNYLEALTSVLSHYSLNALHLVAGFANRTWLNLVGLWGNKDQRSKEQLTIIFRTLLPYYALSLSTETDPSPVVEGIIALWEAITETETKRSADGLPLESLRLHLLPQSEVSAFRACTFQYGHHFDDKQALSWGILELHADCVQKLYLYSERPHATPERPLKRRKTAEDPVTAILRQTANSDDGIRIHSLQLLLFFIDRHWGSLHAELQVNIAEALKTLLSVDKPSVQSWCFLCLAALANASTLQPVETTSSSSSLSYLPEDLWERVWVQAMRSVNTPSVCRAACHVSHVLLNHAKALLHPRKTITEVEVFAKDLSVQGPSFPYDSACALLVLCMRLANQDVRLHQVGIDNKVLTWLMDSWRPGSGRKRLASHTVADVFALLSAIRGSFDGAQLVCETQLPDAPIVSAVEEEHATAVIRDFQLYARLPPVTQGLSNSEPSADQDALQAAPLYEADHERTPLNEKEQRLSAYFIKTLDELSEAWKSPKDAFGYYSADMVRTSLDFVVAVLSFGGSLRVNGTRPDNRAIQAACRLLTQLTPQMKDPQWTITERATIVSALEPLIYIERSESDRTPWDTILRPGAGSGVRTQLLKSLSSDRDLGRRRRVEACRALQHAIFQKDHHAQDCIAQVLQTVRECLKLVALQQSMTGIDDQGFGEAAQTDRSKLLGPAESIAGSRLAKCLTSTWVSSLVIFPSLQSSLEEKTRDRNLQNMILEGDKDTVLLLGTSYLRNIRQGMLDINTTDLISLFKSCERLVNAPRDRRDPQLFLYVIQCLQSSLRQWMGTTDKDLVSSVEGLLGWILKIRDAHVAHWNMWSVRDSFARFLEQLILLYPRYEPWPAKNDQQEARRPVDLLVDMCGDLDIRVRFRVAASNSRIFHVAKQLDISEVELYRMLRGALTNNLERYEDMLTRFVTLGNVMVLCANVRRGSYWNLLESFLYEHKYKPHVTAVLRGVAALLSLPSLAALFELYASQMAYSICEHERDFVLLPPELAGYQDRRQFVEASFPLFAPIALLQLCRGPEKEAKGLRLFNQFCEAAQKSQADGLSENFAEAISYILVDTIANTPSDIVPMSLSEILEALAKTFGVPSTELHSLLRREKVQVVVHILRTLDDHDASPSGTVMSALNARYPPAAMEYSDLTQFHADQASKYYEFNLPCASAAVILQALDKVHDELSIHGDCAVTYHVLHCLFALLERNPIINEQMRILNAICLWVASHHEQFNDNRPEGNRLLRTLFKASANLLSQFDLIRGVKSVLRWVLFRLTRDEELPELLLRVACVAHDWTLSTDKVSAAAGDDLLRWIEDWARGSPAKFAESVNKALSAWPKDLSGLTQEPVIQATCEQLSTILADREFSSNRFRLVRQLRQLADQGVYETSQFARSDFWRLKDFIPVSQHLFSGDIDSFAQLLIQKSGAIDGLEREHNPGRDFLELHLQGERLSSKSKSSKNADYEAIAKRVILATLLKSLSSSSTSRVNLAFMTIRSIFSETQPSLRESKLWKPSLDIEIRLLQTYPASSVAYVRVDMKERFNLKTHPNLAADFGGWIRHVTTTLATFLATNDSFYASLVDILRSDTAFGEEILPLLVYTLLRTERTQRTRPHQQLLSRYFSEVLGSETSSTLSRRAILNTVLHLRHFEPVKASSLLDYDLWLLIDFILLSKNAITCGAYTTALLFLELAAEHGMRGSQDQPEVEQVLYDIYDRIDEPDGFYGIQTRNQQQFLLRSFHHEKQWDKAFQYHGAAVEATNASQTDTQGLLLSMHSFGFDRLAMSTLHNLQFQDQQDSSMIYSLGWRTETWDLPEQAPSHTTDSSLYLALRLLNQERNPVAVDRGVEKVLREEMQTLRSLGDENLITIRAVTQGLMCLEQIRQWRTEEVQGCLRSRTFTDKFDHIFNKLDSAMEFSDFEAIMTTRISLLRLARRQEQLGQLGDMRTAFTRELVDLEARNLVTLSRAAREAGRAQIALNAVVQAQKLHSDNVGFEVSQELAHVLWMMNESMTAMQFLHDVRDGIEARGETQLPREIRKQSMVYALLGSWASQACLEKPASIVTRYFDPAIELLERLKSTDGNRNFASVYHDYAIFAERQYHAIAKSPDLLRLKILIDLGTAKQAPLEKLLQGPLEKDPRCEISSMLAKTERMLRRDREQYDAHQQSRDSFLDRAVEMYSRALESSDEFDDDSAIRLCSLWFANFERSTNEVAAAVSRVPSHKFVFLTHQLCAHLRAPPPPDPSRPMDSSQVVLKLVTRMCIDHPFHCLYSVYCSQASEVQAPSEGAVSVVRTPREQTAANLLQQLQNSDDEQISTRVTNAQRLSAACVEWAMFGIGSKQPPPTVVPPDQLLSRLRNISVPVLTAQVALRPDRQYDQFVSIVRYRSTVTYAGGMNRPKIMLCQGTDGRFYKQLFKGKDDLRQDAVMEQVFELVNVVLRRDRESLRRDLHILTYKIVPLAPQAGVLEWVEHTTPLLSWLPSAHTKYARVSKVKYVDHKAVLKSIKCIEEDLKNGVPVSDEQRKNIFRDICDAWKPVMRHYFTEKQKEPMPWFRMRLHYARSVAATSIVGYLLGLGDRHLSNILIHDKTGEVVHIDLGIAFEQGTLLTIPERVPFRLTRDMVDGFGTSGTKGVFQRCAEQTLRVLRDRSEVIMTVLEVLKYDHLAPWTASDKKMRQAQSEHAQTTDDLEGEALRFVSGLDRSAGHGAEAADRALSTVARKLDKGLSVQFTVNELIAEATDINNLSLMFSGWGAWY